MFRTPSFFQTSNSLPYREEDPRLHLLVAIASRNVNSLIELLQPPYLSTDKELLELSKKHKLLNLSNKIKEFATMPVELALDLCKFTNSMTYVTPLKIVQVLGENYEGLCKFAQVHGIQIPTLEQTIEKAFASSKDKTPVNLFINSLTREEQQPLTYSQ